MSFTSNLSLASAALLVAAFGSQSVKAASISTTNLGTLAGNVTKTGTLTDEAEVIEEAFTVTSASTLTVFTTSYGGGTNLDGTMTAAGGFQPMVTLYDSAGNYVMGEAVTSPLASTDSKTSLALDAYLKDSDMAPGAYIVTLTDIFNQQPVTATNLSDGFAGPGGTTFTDVDGNVRNGKYALNMSVASSGTTTPEPATFWLILPALASAAFFRRRRPAAS
jgi:hypothetical protein